MIWHVAEEQRLALPVFTLSAVAWAVAMLRAGDTRVGVA